MQRRAAFATLGCKVNQYETQIMEQAFSKAGFEIVDSESAADVYVINSCTVTGTGDKKSRQMVRHFRRKNRRADWNGQQRSHYHRRRLDL